jgi:endonuclease/exonuclease/phosphatase family metal-dependent hydrolase
MYSNQGQGEIKAHSNRQGIIRQIVIGFILTAMIALTTVFGQAMAEGEDPPPPAKHQVTVMSRNVYHGVNAEIFRVPGATSFPDLLNRVAAVYLGYQLRNFPERAQAFATEIEINQPDLIGLQEAVLVRTGPLFDPAPGEAVALDYVQILLDALAERGLHYIVVAELQGFDIELPSALGFDVRHTDREVILARADLPPGHMRLSNVQTGSFAVNCQIPSMAFGPITIKRGWVSVDVWTRGREFRFISTHLDGDCLPVTSLIQVAQAQQIVNGPAVTSLPVVLVGDINASPLSPAPSAYQVITGNGFLDAWQTAGAGDGFTCCQADDLLNPTPTLDTRIDVIMYREKLDPRSIYVVGDNPADRTPSGFWPSDHGGVAAILEIAVP